MNFKDGYTAMYPREYAKYRAILQRTSPSTANKKSIENYISKGITCCPEWKNSFKTFMQDMGKCPDGYEIDRVDNTKGYCKENCRWSTREMNQYNRGKFRNNLSQLPKGVRYNKRLCKFTSQICINHVSYHLGVFLTKEDAGEAYEKVAKEWYGF
jgi:hypothetical protein